MYYSKSACRSIIQRIYKFWLWIDLIYKISHNGRTFYKSIRLLHNFTDNVCILYNNIIIRYKIIIYNYLKY